MVVLISWFIECGLKNTSAAKRADQPALLSPLGMNKLSPAPIPRKEFTLDFLSLYTASGMLVLEINLLAFLLQGNVTGLVDFQRIFIISVLVLGFDLLLKCCAAARPAFYNYINVIVFLNSIAYLLMCLWEMELALGSGCTISQLFAINSFYLPLLYVNISKQIFARLSSSLIFMKEDLLLENVNYLKDAGSLMLIGINLYKTCE
ncbi:hypothetical protein HHK36_007343 [Tetracentron sinense]|uniref:Uncharacterized protein n=1 Tax=Tetracentron sinense TaxID=13715 RepID=A0A834ZIR2_TETSI|nr:hypothetical protein HHK36_007343 [Tetracentron sinense]